MYAEEIKKIPDLLVTFSETYVWTPRDEKGVRDIWIEPDSLSFTQLDRTQLALIRCSNLNYQ